MHLGKDLQIYLSNQLADIVKLKNRVCVTDVRAAVAFPQIAAAKPLPQSSG